MRPALLDPLFASARSLPGVGPKIAALFARAIGTDDEEPLIRDLLFHLPSGFIDRRKRPPLYEMPPSGPVTVEGVVERIEKPRGYESPWRIVLAERNATIQIVYFKAQADWLKKLYPIGARLVVSGDVEWFDMRPQIRHPDYVLPAERATELPAIEPTYGLTQGLSPKIIRRSVGEALKRLPGLPEWLSPDLVSARGWPAFSDALRQVHAPKELEGSGPSGPAWQRLAFDELVASQLALALVRGTAKRRRGTEWRAAGKLKAKIESALPFSLTRSQRQAVAEIEKDLAGSERMVRLLQGDVGSGKTIVALIAMAQVVEAGGQAALMAPTELLARQHHATIAPLAAAAGIETVLLTGRDPASERSDALARIADGAAQIVVGTHALFQAGVTFRRLGLAVVDEQHRFGVHQRLAISAKGDSPDMLVMTATPIPRTLVLSYFGDMEVSRLTEKPAGRQPVETRAVPLDRLGEVVERIGRAVDAGGKAYWVCPLVAESEKSDLAPAEERYAALSARFGRRVGLVHGRMKTAEKDREMERFRSGETVILVSTTVVEVGVDVPDATIMVIEHAERFGLAQLHQLRGRVGRGEARSACLLLYRPPLGETARARLAIMRETEDGFRIAEEDLRLRGEGDLLGTRQSGMPGFRIALPDVHAELLQVARDEAKLALARDPDFSSPRAEALRLLLYLFGRDDAVRLMRAG
ncbi:MAG: ATP-dependent DNA helicase RecG [Propylenella sp.]